MVKHSPFQADLFTIPSLEKQVAMIKADKGQINSTPTNTAKAEPLQDTELFSKIKALEIRVEELESMVERKRGWFRF